MSIAPVATGLSNGFFSRQPKLNAGHENSPARSVAEHTASFAGWIPIRLFVRDNALWVDWCFRGQHRFTRPFFREDAEQLLRLPFNVAFRRQTPMSALVAWAERGGDGVQTAPLKALVGHVSRCGSTLIAQMLAAQPTHIVMSEPPMLDVLFTVRERLAHVSRAQQVRWLRALVFALGQVPWGVHEAQHLVIKLDAWHVWEYDLIRETFPDVPFVFLFRDPIEVAASQYRRRASYMEPSILSAVSRRVVPASASCLSVEDHIAAILGHIYSVGATICEGQGAIGVSYEALPSVIWTQLRETLGLRSDRAVLESLEASARRDAKRPNEAFAADSQQKQDEVTLALRTAVNASCATAYARLRDCCWPARSPLPQ